MSVYGGDSWAREAHHRKRRVDDLMIDGLDSSSFKKLSNGKFTCLVCPSHPLLDSSLMLSMHSKGARHKAALSKLKERELVKQAEINKRIALSDHSPGSSVGPRVSIQKPRFPSKPLIEQTRQAASEVLSAPSVASQSNIHGNKGVSSSTCSVHQNSELDHRQVESHHTTGGGADVATAQLQSDFRERRERELKFTAAGWKRDCHGKWYQDENVEFDSDEEDPNISLA